ncbi:MAG TPA: flagellar hook-length control protein FliK [Alphaproteobacteria bacterium]|nr:flagellar hook-length control protein FliK [Alphaproteobacteria bacterium]
MPAETSPTEALPSGATKAPDAGAASQPAFAEQLANANGKSAEVAPAKSKAKNDPSARAEAIVTPAAAEPTTAAAVNAPASTTSDNRAQRDAANGNPAPQVRSAPANAATIQTAQTAPGAAPPSLAPTAQAQAAPAVAEPADDAQIVAIIRTPTQQTAAAATPAASETSAPAASFESQQKDLGSDVKATAEPAKPDAPRPFGTLAPGLGLAAQITAQQTPEQANAADRLAQLAVATEETTPSPNTDVEPAPPADKTASSPRTDQPAPIEASASRQATADVTAANAAARAARPNFHPVVTQVAAQVAQAAADGTDRINIRLSPAELGRIDVKLDFGPDGRVQAVFAAERPQTMELLQRDARDLERALQDAGLRADSGSLSFNLRGNGRENRGEQAPGDSRTDAPPADVAAAQLQAYSAGLGGSGRLDIRI